MEALRPQGVASRQGIVINIVPLDPAYKAGLAGHLPVSIVALNDKKAIKHEKRIDTVL